MIVGRAFMLFACEGVQWVATPRTTFRAARVDVDVEVEGRLAIRFESFKAPRDALNVDIIAVPVVVSTCALVATEYIALL